MKYKEIPRECLGWGMQIMSVLVAEINHRSLRLGTESRNRIDAQTVYTRVSFAYHGNNIMYDTYMYIYMWNVYILNVQ